MDNVTNIIRLKTNEKLKMSVDGDFFRSWVEFTKPIHNLPKKQMEVFAAFLQERYRLSKVIIDQSTLDDVLMSVETKRRIKAKCGITTRHLQVIMGNFKKKGVLVDGKIFLPLVPQLNEDGAGLLIIFDFKDEQHIRLGNQESSPKPAIGQAKS